MNPQAFALVGLMVLVAILAAILVFALSRFAAAVRRTPGSRADTRENAVLSAALEEAVARLKAHEQAMSARAVASEQLSEQIVASLTAGLLVVDRNGIIEIVNPAATRLLGQASTVVGMDYRRALAPAVPLVDVIGECLSSRRAIVRRTLQLPTGLSASHLGVTVSPLAGNNELGGAICLFSDLTAVMQMEDELRLKDALARLGELTAGLAHEFRNGLATIHGYSRLIDLEALPPTYRSYVEEIRKETDALGRVVTNFLNFAKPEQMAFAPVSLEALVCRVAEEMRHELPAGTTIETQGSFGDIDGDEVLLKQAFTNLVRNAAEACTTVDVTPSIVITASTAPGQTLCQVSVEDNGSGIPESAKDRVFRPFFTMRSNGTGLGLAIVQKIVLAHNGRIVLGQSRRGGARFDLTFTMRETDDRPVS